jgi:hypothetical protein
MSAHDFPQAHDDNALETLELLQQRWAQRFLLRAIPDFIVTGTSRSRRKDQYRPHDVDVTRVERGLRMEADELALPLELTLSSLADHADAELLRRFLESNWPSDFSSVAAIAPFTAPGQDHALRSTSERAKDRSETEQSELGYQATRDLVAISFLLLWADDLAGDYEDPRVTT